MSPKIPKKRHKKVKMSSIIVVVVVAAVVPNLSEVQLQFSFFTTEERRK